MGIYSNIQHQCLKLSKDSLSVLFPPEWLQAVQVLMVLSVIFSAISFLVFLGQLFTMSRGGLFYLTGVCQAFASKCFNLICFIARGYHLQPKPNTHFSCSEVEEK